MRYVVVFKRVRRQSDGKRIMQTLGRVECDDLAEAKKVWRATTDCFISEICVVLNQYDRTITLPLNDVAELFYQLQSESDLESVLGDRHSPELATVT